MNENASLMRTIQNQNVQLQFQKDEQREMRSVIQGLQEQVDLLRASSQPQAQNGAVNDSEVMQVVMQLRNEIRMLQGQTPMPMMTPMPVAPSPVPIPMFTPVGHNTPLSQMSACAGFNPSVSNSPSKPTPSTSAAPWPSGPQSPGGSSSSSSDAGKGRGGDWGNPGDGNPSSRGVDRQVAMVVHPLGLVPMF